jgi:type II secretory pathway pseudopilin PulG
MKSKHCKSKKMAPTQSIKKKLSFSLLEIIVVFMLLAVMSGVAGISYLKITQQGRFQDSVTIIREKITLAKRLALLTQGSVSLIFDRSGPNGEISYTMKGEALPNQQVKNALEKKEFLPTVGHLAFESRADVPYAWPICLVFYPNGACFSHTIAIKEKLSLKVDPSFKGTSATLSIYTPNPPDDLQEGSSFYPHELENQNKT